MRVVRVPGDEVFRAVPAEGSDAPPDAEVDEDPLAAYPLVVVSWHDAYFDFDQESADDCRPDYLVTTVGFLVHEGPRFVSVAQEVLPDGDGFRAVTHIPVSVVESVTPLHAGPAAIASPEVG